MRLDHSAHDLFLLMLDLSRVEDERKIISLFTESINSLSEGFTIRYSKEAGHGHDTTSIAIKTTRSHFGHFILTGAPPPLPADSASLLSNVINMLAVILENRRQAILLAKDNERLEDLVKIQITSLHHSEKRYRTLFQLASDGILVADVRSKRFVNANKAICKMLGYTQDEILRLGVDDIHPEEDLPRVFEAFNRQAKEVFKSASGLPVKRKDGTVFYADINSSPLLLDEQQLLIGIFRDITERKNAEQLLVTQKENAQRYLDLAGVMFAALDKTGAITLINRKGCDILGVKEDEVLGKNWFDYFLPKKMVPEVKGVFDKLMAGDIEPVEYYENPILTGDGDERIVAFHNTVLRDSAGDINGVLFSGEDVTSRKRYEEELQKWWQVFKNAEWGVVVSANDQKTFQMMNPAYARMHGYSTEELMQMEIADVFAPAFRPQLPATLRRCHEKGHYCFEADHVRKDGSIFPAHNDVTTIKDEKGEVLYRIANIQDITERKQAEEERKNLEIQLRQSQKMEALGTMAGGIAHDFNNILTAIVGYAEMIRDQVPNNARVREDIDQILFASGRAANLVRQILSFSRKSEHALIPVLPHTIVMETLNLLRSTIPTTVSICQDIDPRCGTIHADPTKIHQVLMNLCSNAVHAIEEKGIIKITLSQAELTEKDLPPDSSIFPGPHMVLSVEDNGTGMDSETQRKIFDPFFTTKEPGKGTGMGLSVVHGIVSSHNGMITVDSRPGSGSTFTVYIPIIPGREITSRQTADDEGLPTGTERILFIDDEELLTKLGSRLLENLGYRVTPHTSSNAGLDSFRANPDAFDLVITDQTMPELSGSELAAELLKIRPDIPIILCTGYSSKVSEDDFMKIGIREFMMKPYEKRNLAMTVRRTLDK